MLWNYEHNSFKAMNSECKRIYFIPPPLLFEYRSGTAQFIASYSGEPGAFLFLTRRFVLSCRLKIAVILTKPHFTSKICRWLVIFLQLLHHTRNIYWTAVFFLLIDQRIMPRWDRQASFPFWCCWASRMASD